LLNLAKKSWQNFATNMESRFGGKVNEELPRLPRLGEAYPIDESETDSEEQADKPNE
jgi:hypothetical protein